MVWKKVDKGSTMAQWLVWMILARTSYCSNEARLIFSLSFHTLQLIRFLSQILSSPLLFLFIFLSLQTWLLFVKSLKMRQAVHYVPAAKCHSTKAKNGNWLTPVGMNVATLVCFVTKYVHYVVNSNRLVTVSSTLSLNPVQNFLTEKIFKHYILHEMLCTFFLRLYFLLTIPVIVT